MSRQVATPSVIYTSHRAAVAPPDQRVPLVDLLDRVLARGVVVCGELTLTIAEVDLVHISLRALLSSVRPDLFAPAPADVDEEHPR
ncbi:MAG TPA: gas vesicle protein [Natronosporangium sp.]|nr:gas vesicle protein [Natronosporangium sp.]